MKTWLVLGAIVVAAVVVVFVVTQVNKAPEVAPQEVAVPTAQKPSNPQEAFLVENAKQPGWTTLPSGLQYKVITPAVNPAAPKPAPCSEVTVHYEGHFIDGKEFDSSIKRGEPATFPLGGVISGWTEGVAMMREGEKWEFAIPSKLGYGDNGRPSIPGGSTLIFTVELLKVHSPWPPAPMPVLPATDPRAKQQAFLVENAKQPGWTTTPSGLQYKVVTAAANPTAPKPAACSEVTVHYEGRLIDGTVFDSSIKRGQPATFPLGGVIPGWTEGVALMREGEKWEFVMASNLAYGDRGAPPDIAGGATLQFTVELLKAHRPAQ